MSRVAVLFDGDNVLPFASGDLPPVLAAAARDRPAARAVVAQIEEIVQELGDVVVREAYGRWDNAARHVPAALLADLAYRLRHVPPLSVDTGETHGLKNAADILLSVRAMVHARALDTIVLVAMDSDYQPLVAELRAAGVTVVGIGFERPGRQALILRSALDLFVPLDDVEGWTAITAYRRSGVLPGVIRAAVPREMPTAQVIAPRPPMPRPPAVAPAASAIVPGPRRPRPRDPAARADLAAAATAVAAALPADDGIRLPVAALVETLASFGVHPGTRSAVPHELERAGWLRLEESDAGHVLAPAERWRIADEASRVDAVTEAVLICTMIEGDTIPGRSDNPLDARLAFVRERLECRVEAGMLLRLAAGI